jgi:predicted DNA-binding protein YlxM (UPF0122 family)
MAAKPLNQNVIDSIIADWRTGAYSQQKIADKYKVSKGAVNKICKNVEQDVTAIVTAGIEYKCGLAEHDDRIVTAINEVVTNESERIFKFKTMRDKITEKAFNRIDRELTDCEVQHIKPLIEAADKTCVMAEIAPRFNPTATTINNLNAQQNIDERKGENGFKLVFEDAEHKKP